MLAEFAAVYEQGMERGVMPRQLDEFELWEVGVLFGLHREVNIGGSGLTGDALIAARVAAAREGRPQPEAAAAVLPPDFGIVGLVPGSD